MAQNCPRCGEEAQKNVHKLPKGAEDVYVVQYGCPCGILGPEAEDGNKDHAERRAESMWNCLEYRPGA